MSKIKATDNFDELLEKLHEDKRLAAIVRSLVADVKGMRMARPDESEGDDQEDWFGWFDTGAEHYDSGEHAISWYNLSRLIKEAEAILEGRPNDNGSIFVRGERDATRLVGELLPLIVSETGVLVKPSFAKQLMLRLANAARTEEEIREIRFAKRVLAGDLSDDYRTALVDLMSSIGFDMPECCCDDGDIGEHEEGCPLNEWRNA